MQRRIKGFLSLRLIHNTSEGPDIHTWEKVQTCELILKTICTKNMETLAETSRCGQIKPQIEQNVKKINAGQRKIEFVHKIPKNISFQSLYNASIG